MASRTNTPAMTAPEADATNNNATLQEERDPSPAPAFGGLVATENAKEVSPAPDVAVRKNNTSALSALAAADEYHAKVFKRGDAIGVKEARPTNVERVQNVGLFGFGGGNFDMRGNMKQSPLMFDQSPTLGKKNPKSLLGDFTLYRVNKEFENFWDAYAL